MAHIDELHSPRHLTEPRSTHDKHTFDWTTLVVPIAAMCTLAWFIVLALVAVWAIGSALV